jgi:hypothetical protein
LEVDHSGNLSSLGILSFLVSFNLLTLTKFRASFKAFLRDTEAIWHQDVSFGCVSSKG